MSDVRPKQPLVKQMCRFLSDHSLFDRWYHCASAFALHLTGAAADWLEGQS